MRWYEPLRTSSKPPAYIVERVSDLQYAIDLARRSPSGAREVLDGIIEQLGVHMDNEYVDDLQTASDIILDNPQKAMSLIGIVVSFMQADKRRHDKEKANPWKSLWQK